MREIKFKAKRLDNDKWAYGYGVIIADDFCVLDKRDELYIQRPYTFRNNTHWFELCGIMCDTNTLSQFTGLCDYDGREIFEGDIVKCCHMIPNFGWSGGAEEQEEEVIGAVEYRRGGFCIGEYPIVSFQNDEMEVVGNIFDNPELLNRKTSNIDIRDLSIGDWVCADQCRGILSKE